MCERKLGNSILLKIDKLVIVIVEHQWVPILDTRIQVIDQRIPIEKDNRRLTQPELLGLMQNRKTLLRISGLSSLIQQLVVFPIAPAGIVIAIAGSPDAQKSNWIHKIADPSGTRNVVVQTILRVQVHLPFLILYSHVNIQLLLPHLLDRLRYRPVPLVRISQDVKLRETASVRVSGFSEQLARPIRIIVDDVQRFVIPHPGRYVTGRRLLLAARNVSDDRFTVDREVQGEAHFGVIKWFSRYIDPVKVGTFIWIDPNQLRMLPAIVWNFVE